MRLTTTESVIEPSNNSKKHQPYKNYRKSDVWGIDHLPIHWQTKPLKSLVQINTDKLSETTDPDFEIEYVDIGNVNLQTGINSTERFRFENAPSRARRMARHGDTIISTVRTYLKAVAQIVNPPDNLIVSTGFAVLTPTTALDPGYLYRLVQSEPFVERIMANSVGVSYPAINVSLIGRFSIPVPPLDEQRAIAAFLDRETAYIDKLIEKNERIALLIKSERITLITDLISHGTKPSPALRDTAIPWFARIPSHWEIHSLRRCVDQFIDYRGRTPTKTDFGVHLITAGAIKEGEINHSLAPEFIADSDYEDWMSRGKPEIGDVVITTEAPLGEVALVTDTSIALAQRIILFKVNRKRILPEYLRYYYLSECGKSELSSRASGSTASGIRADRLRASFVIVPPLHEQENMVKLLDAEIQRILRPLENIQRVTSRLKEYRSALISASVTGQINVRQENTDAS